MSALACGVFSSWGDKSARCFWRQACAFKTRLAAHAAFESDICWSADVPSEKRTRGLLRSAVDRRLSKRAVLVVDSLNNIKGYRWAALLLALSF